jgi:enamine deaminase RidA (YjgF/YER057c/UK114 family)
MPFYDTSYLIIQPTSTGDFYSDWQDCREQIVSLINNTVGSIFKINIFVNAEGVENFRVRKQFISNALSNIFGELSPTFAILAQSPEKPFNLNIEIGIVNSSDIRIEYRKYKGYHYTIIENDNHKQLWANGITDSNPDLNTETSSINAFEIVREMLLTENMTFDHIVRQWNYIGSILHTDQKDQLLIQHYQIFNDVRNAYYSRYRSIPDFPAATGIGMDFNDVAIDFCAITSQHNEMLIASVNNPKQINPYSYDQGVLIGTPADGQAQKTPPQFERAKLLQQYEKSQLFVSGTASILGQETKGKNDVKEQTRITIENIKSLIARENLIHHCSHLSGATPDKYRYIRVYVKNNEDITVVKSICSAYFGNVPINYVQADICREDLLVEIEAELSSK